LSARPFARILGRAVPGELSIERAGVNFLVARGIASAPASLLRADEVAA
jgi:hypothetical protein